MERGKRIKVTDENLPQYYQRVGEVTEDGKATIVATFDKGLGTMIFLKSQVEPFVPLVLSPKDYMMLPDLPALSFEEELEDMEPMVVSPRDYDPPSIVVVSDDEMDISPREVSPRFEDDDEDLILLEQFEADQAFMKKQAQELTSTLYNVMYVFLEMTHEPYPSIHYYKDKLPSAVYKSDEYKM